MFQPVYFDHNATTPIDAAVLEAMLPWLSPRFGNPSSRHEYGRAAKAAIGVARQQVAAAVGAHPTEVVFTSSGSEANNFFLKGYAAQRQPGTLAVSAIEHPCILRPAEQLQRQGWKLHKLAVGHTGRLARQSYTESMNSKPDLVSVMMANNETGVIQETFWLAEVAQAADAIFHTDAVQALGRLPLDFRALNQAGVRALTLSAHKAGGPKGAAALIHDKKLLIEPLIAGGGQEQDLRSGTENVPAIVGFGLACELAAERLAGLTQHLLALRTQLETGLAGLGARIFGQTVDRLCNTTYFALPDIDGETLVGKLDRVGFAVASGAACSSTKPGISPVLAAMGVAPELARGAIRISLGSENDPTQIDAFLKTLKQTMLQLKRLTAVAI